MKSAKEAAQLKAWLDEPENFAQLKADFDSTSRFARLRDVMHPRLCVLGRGNSI
jgi:hydroxymethylglutaryl-CoA reductase